MARGFLFFVLALLALVLNVMAQGELDSYVVIGESERECEASGRIDGRNGP